MVQLVRTVNRESPLSPGLLGLGIKETVVTKTETIGAKLHHENMSV